MNKETIKDMKKILTSIALLFFCVAWASAQNYTLKIRGGISDEGLKQKMETRISSLLTEVSQATKAGRLLRLQQVEMKQDIPVSTWERGKMRSLGFF